MKTAKDWINMPKEEKEKLITRAIIASNKAQLKLMCACGKEHKLKPWWMPWWLKRLIIKLRIK